MNSYLTFFKKNKKKTSIMFLIIIISVFCIFFVYTMVDSVYNTSEKVRVAPFERFSIVNKQYGYDVDNSLEGILKSENSFKSFLTVTDIKTIFGTSSSYLVFPEKYDDIERMMKCLGITLADGNLPENDSNQLIMHENVMKNKDLKIGDKIQEFEIVGSFVGDVELSLGFMEENRRNEYSGAMETYLICSNDSLSLSQINQELSKVSASSNEIIVSTYENVVKALDEEFSMIKLVLLLVVVLISICIVIAVTSLIYILYMGRYEEFAILNAIGYDKREIKHMILCEMIFIALVSWIVGIMVAGVSLFAVNISIYSNMGQSMDITNKSGLFISLIVPIMVIVISSLTTSRKLSKTDLISIIERR